MGRSTASITSLLLKTWNGSPMFRQRSITTSFSKYSRFSNIYLKLVPPHLDAVFAVLPSSCVLSLPTYLLSRLNSLIQFSSVSIFSMRLLWPSTDSATTPHPPLNSGTTACAIHVPLSTRSLVSGNLVAKTKTRPSTHKRWSHPTQKLVLIARKSHSTRIWIYITHMQRIEAILARLCRNELS